jgi:hypothetical protein
MPFVDYKKPEKGCVKGGTKAKPRQKTRKRGGNWKNKIIDRTQES